MQTFHSPMAQKGPKRQFFVYFLDVFPYIWPLAGPNIAKKGGPLQALARGDRQTHFGTFNFWVTPGFEYFSCHWAAGAAESRTKPTMAGLLGYERGCSSSWLDQELEIVRIPGKLQ